MNAMQYSLEDTPGRPYDSYERRFIVGREESKMYKVPVLDQFGNTLTDEMRHRRISAKRSRDIRYGIAIHPKELNIEEIYERHLDR
jgi:hypothetical protein